MTDNKEIEGHIRALSEWAKQDGRRVAFVACGEITEKGMTGDSCLIGRTDRAARVLYGSYRESAEHKHVIDLLSELLNSPMLAYAFCEQVSRDRDEPDKEPEERDDVFTRIIKEFRDILGGK